MSSIFRIQSHRNGQIKSEGHSDSFDEALIQFFLVPSRWAKIIVKTDESVCVKAYGEPAPVEELKRNNHVTETSLGGETERHEVYWDVNGAVNHMVFEDLEHAESYTSLVGTEWAYIIVRSSDNACVDSYGQPQVVKKLQQYAYC